MKKNFVSKRFDISTLKGLKSAERYKASLNKKYDNVKVRTVGINTITIEGYD